MMSNSTSREDSSAAENKIWSEKKSTELAMLTTAANIPDWPQLTVLE